jgi:molybdopterin molybdotransferase
MINVTEAKQLIIANCPVPKTKTLPLLEATGSILAEAVYSLIDTPPFHQSAMDGYAFSYEGWDKKSPLLVNGEIQTGNYYNKPIPANEAIRIFTGAPVPPGADTVVMQEKVVKDNNAIIIQDEYLTKGSNVRLQGSQTKKGEVAIQQGQLLTPTGISFLAGIGISKVNVFSKPLVSIIVTGKELTKAGNEITEGKIFESNSIGLRAALQQLNIKEVSVEVVDDDENEITNAITRNLDVDILILTGGVSVGDYDLVPASLEKCGVVKVFHKVKQKPGKPFYFGKVNQTLVFALPGNPAAVMSCFYEYVVPAISSFTQINYFKKLLLPLSNDFHKKAGLTYFLKGKTGEKDVAILNNQESYLLNSFAVADCLVELEEAKEHFKKGDLVNICMII